MTQKEREKEIVRIKLETRGLSEDIKRERTEESNRIDRELAEYTREQERKIKELNEQRIPLFEDYKANLGELKRIGMLVREIEFSTKAYKVEIGCKKKELESVYATRLREVNMQRDRKILELL